MAQPYTYTYTTHDTASPPYNFYPSPPSSFHSGYTATQLEYQQPRTTVMEAFAEMDSQFAATDHRVDSLRPPDLPEPEPPNAHPDWQQLYHFHAARQPYFQQPQPPCVGPEWYGIPQTNQFGYHPCQPPNQPLDPLVDHLPPPPPQYTPDLEPNLSVAALVSQLERLTADVEQLVSRMDANERLLGDPHAATQPPSAPLFSIPYTAPVSCPLPQPTIAARAVLHHAPHQVSTPNPLQPDRYQQPASHSSKNLGIEGIGSCDAKKFIEMKRDRSFELENTKDNDDLLKENRVEDVEKIPKRSRDGDGIMYSNRGGKIINVGVDTSHPIEPPKGAAFAPKQRPCSFDPGGDSSPKQSSEASRVDSWRSCG